MNNTNAEDESCLPPTDGTVPPELTAEDEQLSPEAQETFSKAYDFLLHRAATRQITKVDLSTYTLPWAYDELRQVWICDVPPNRGSVLLTRPGWFWEWQGCIEQPDRFKRSGPFFRQLEQALNWVEQELLALQSAAEGTSHVAQVRSLGVADFSLEKRPDLAPYWITPEAIEPRITYRVLINLEYTPYDYESMEMSFGKKWRYNERFITPTKLAQEVRINADRVFIEQPIGRDDGWYRITSSASYYSESLAATQAQQLWDMSTIVQQHNAGKVIRAQYGYIEVETGYRVMLGGCEAPDKPYPAPLTRAEYMAELALRETLIYALDVEGFRAYLGLTPQDFDDETLLTKLHSKRVESPHIPAAAKLESQQWLAAHRVNERRGKR